MKSTFAILVLFGAVAVGMAMRAPFNEKGEARTGGPCFTEDEIEAMNDKAGNPDAYRYHPCEYNGVCINQRCEARATWRLPLVRTPEGIKMLGLASPFNDRGEFRTGGRGSTEEEIEARNARDGPDAWRYHPCEYNGLCVNGSCHARATGKLPLRKVIGGMGSPFNENGELRAGSSCATKNEIDAMSANDGIPNFYAYHPCEKGTFCIDHKCVAISRRKGTTVESPRWK